MSNTDGEPTDGPDTRPARKARSWTSEVCLLVNQRYKELGHFQEQLEKESKKLRWMGRSLKISLIIVGALSATKAASTAFIDPGARQGIAIYAVLGALTTIIAGLSTGFKLDESSGQLAGLAAETASTRGIILYTWYKVLLEHARTLAAATADKSEIKLIGNCSGPCRRAATGLTVGRLLV
jgi:hypothetical protein